MNRFTRVIRMINSAFGGLSGLGGVTQNRMISPKGLYSRPKEETGLVISLSEGVSQDIFLALQKEKDLGDGDVIFTDDKSFIQLHFDGNKIVIESDKVVTNCKSYTVNCDAITFNAKSVDFNGCTVKNDGISIDKTHKHPQKDDNNGAGGGVDTGTPN